MSSSCPACGVALAPESRFCHACGARILASPAAVPARFAAPVNYTPRHLAERILTYRSSLEGEHKSVTVVFCDIVESTALAERIGPEAMFGLLNRFFETALVEVHRYEGTINQFLGDGFMAIFGAPVALEWHARLAVKAAQAMQDAVRVHQRELTGSAGIELSVRFGLNTGRVVVGRIGDNLRMDYTAVGDITNVAARLLDLARPGQIVLTQSTYDRVHGLVDTEPPESVVLKGKKEPIAVYRLWANRAARSSGANAAGRPLSGFVGRDREIAELREALTHAQAGHGQAVGIVSEPGMGKSRLLWEFRESLADSLVVYLDGQCLPYGATIPYLPILDILRTNCGIAETDAPEAVIEKLRGSVVAVGMDPTASLPYLLNIFGLKEDPNALTTVSPEALQSRTFDTLRQLCLKGSQRRPIVLAIEDLHWIDKTSEDFLSFMADNLTGMSILFLSTYRPGYAPSWINKSYATQIALRPLSESSALAVVSSVLRAHGKSSVSAAEIVTRGEGNPLFLEELAHALADHGGGPFSVPETLHGVLTARIDRLPEDVKRLLQVASVLGREFSMRLLEAVWDDPASLDAHVRRLTRLEFLYERAWEPMLVYAFKHALTREAAYSSLLDSRRRLLHARTGRTLEVLHADRLDEVLELLAHHFALSDDDERAVDYAIRASERAQKRWANTEALAHADVALRRLDTMPDSSANRIRRVDAILNQAEVRFAVGKHADQVTALEQVRPLIEAGMDAPRRAAWHYWMGFLHSLIGSKPDVAIAYCREASTIAQAAQLEELQAFADSCLAQVLFFAGEPEKAMEVGERALAVFERQGNRWWACRTLAHLSSIANVLAQWDRGLAYCRRALDYGTAMNDLRIKVSALIRTASTHIQRGDSSLGLRFCDEAGALRPIQYDAAALRAIRGYGLIKARRAPEGIAEIQQALEWYEQSHLRYTRCQFSLWLAEGLLQIGDVTRAELTASETANICRELGYGRLLAVANTTLKRSRESSEGQ